MNDFTTQPEYRSIPTYMLDIVCRYVVCGRPTGDFLAAVIQNQFCEAVFRADDDNEPILKSYALLVYNHIPAICRYDDEYGYKEWVEGRGLYGMMLAKLDDHYDAVEATRNAMLGHEWPEGMVSSAMEDIPALPEEELDRIRKVWGYE